MELNPSKSILFLVLACGLIMLWGLSAHAQSPERAVRKTDYGVMWWSKSFRKAASLERTMRLNIQTGRYGLQLSPYSASQICRMGPVPDGLTREDAMRGQDELVNGLPEVSSKVWVEVDGKTCDFKASRLLGPMGKAEAQFTDNMWRVIESGPLSRRFDISNIRYNGTGNKLRGRLEIQSLPEFLNIIYEVTPLETIPGDSKVAFSLTLPADWTVVEWLNGDPASGALTVRGSKGAGASFMVSPGEFGTPHLDIAGNVLTFSLDKLQLDSCESWYDARYGFNVTVIPSADATNEDIRDYRAVAAVEVSAQAIAPAGEPSTSYDPALGMHEVALKDFSVSMGSSSTAQDLSALERYRVKLTNPGAKDLYVPVVFTKARNEISYVTGYVAMLRDVRTGEPTGIPVQMSKNWHTRPGVPMLYDGAWARNTTIVKVPARGQVEYELTIAVQNWGGVPSASVAQLCLVGWGTNGLWIESALGSHGESICFEPDGTQMGDGSMIDDIRPFQVAGMSGSSGKPGSWDRRTEFSWTTNVGGGNFLVVNDEKNRPLYLSNVKTDFVRYGPNLTELNFHYLLGDAVEADVRSYLTRTDDFVRVIYKLRYDVVKDLTYKRLALFQMGSDSYAASEAGRLAIGNGEGLVEAFKASPLKNAYVRDRLGIGAPGQDPWVCLYEENAAKPNESGATGNRGLVVREWNARLGGAVAAAPHFSVRNTTGWPTQSSAPQWELSAETQAGTLKAGDFVETTIEFVVLPQYIADYYGASQYLPTLLKDAENSWVPFFRYARDNRLEVVVKRGTLARSVPTAIRVDAMQSAEFSVSGGIGYVPISFTGLDGSSGYVLEANRGGKWEALDQSVHGNDFWQADTDKVSGATSLTFNIERTVGEEPSTRTEYRFRHK